MPELSNLTAASAGNLQGTAIAPVTDAAGTPTTVKATLAQLRTKMFAGSTGYTATDPLVVGAITASGDFAIATNKFTVASATGNTVVAGTLVVTGAATFEAETNTFISATVVIVNEKSTPGSAVNGASIIQHDFYNAGTRVGVVQTSSRGALDSGGFDIYAKATGGALTQVLSLSSGASTFTGTLGVTGKITASANIRLSNAFYLTGNLVAGTEVVLIGRNASDLVSIDPDGYGIVTGSALKVSGAFGCNAATAQTAYASGGALAAYAAGANGLDSGANMSALHAMVVSIRAALVANGIMS